MPGGHARRIWPAGMTEGRAPKDVLFRGSEGTPEGVRAPAAAGPHWVLKEGEEGGRRLPPSNFPRKRFLNKRFPKEHPPGDGGLGGGRGGPPQKNSHIFIFKKNFPKGPMRPQAVRGCWNGREVKVLPPPQEKDGARHAIQLSSQRINVQLCKVIRNNAMHKTPISS